MRWIRDLSFIVGILLFMSSILLTGCQPREHIPDKAVNNKQTSTEDTSSEQSDKVSVDEEDAIVINNDNASIEYVGLWYHSNDGRENDYMEDVHYGVGDGVYFEYMFIGTGIDFVTEKNKLQGTVDIYIDGEFQKAVDCYHSTKLAQQAVFSKRGLPKGSHTIRVEKKTGQFVLCDAFKIYGALVQNTYYVVQSNPNASDSNPGTQELPWKTIGKASSTATAGDTVIIGSGIYRESITAQFGGASDASRISYIAQPGEEVIVSGADILSSSDWVQDGNSWRHVWNESLPPTGDKSPNKELALRREMVIVNGEVYKPVAERGELVEKSFWVEGPPEAPSNIYICMPQGMTPDGNTIEAAKRGRLFDANGNSYLYVKGLKFRYASNGYQQGAVYAGGSASSHNIFEDVIVEWTNSIGLSLGYQSTYNTMRNCISRDNGEMGYNGGGDHHLLENCQSLRNNWKGYDYLWEAGGGKFSETNFLHIKNFHSEDNTGVGLWLDIDNYDAVIEGCTIFNNLFAGLMIELNTERCTAKNNVVYGTKKVPGGVAGAGVLLQAASHNLIVHNTFIGNEGPGIWNHHDNRQVTEYNEFYNNICINNSANGATLYDGAAACEVAIEGVDQAGARTNELDGNLYYHEPQSGFYTFFTLYGWGNHHYTNEIETWRAWIQQDANSRNVDPLIEDVSSQTGWHLTSDSPARGAGVTLPIVVSIDKEGDDRPSSGADAGADQYTSR